MSSAVQANEASFNYDTASSHDPQSMHCIEPMFQYCEEGNSKTSSRVINNKGHYVHPAYPNSNYSAVKCCPYVIIKHYIFFSLMSFYIIFLFYLAYHLL